MVVGIIASWFRIAEDSQRSLIEINFESHRWSEPLIPRVETLFVQCASYQPVRLDALSPTHIHIRREPVDLLETQPSMNLFRVILGEFQVVNSVDPLSLTPSSHGAEGNYIRGATHQADDSEVTRVPGACDSDNGAHESNDRHRETGDRRGITV